MFICLGKKSVITHVQPSTADAHIQLTEILTACQQVNKLSSHLRVNTLLLYYKDDSAKSSYAEIAAYFKDNTKNVNTLHERYKQLLFPQTTLTAPFCNSDEMCSLRGKRIILILRKILASKRVEDEM
jgi:hypothetical protein